MFHLIVIVVVALAASNVASDNDVCVKSTPCSCTMPDGSFVDLGDLRSSLLNVSDTTGKSTYLYNPCAPLKDMRCKDALLCKVSLFGSEVLGTTDNVSFMKGANYLEIHYKVNDSESVVALICDNTGVDQLTLSSSNLATPTTKFQLRSKYACKQTPGTSTQKSTATTGTTKKPTETTKKPTVTTNKPTGSTKKPTGTTKKPTGTTKKPTGTTKKPTGTTKKPTGTTKKPTGTTKKPTGTTKKPTGTTKKPTGTTKKPTGTTKKPTGTTKKPTGTTKKPTGTTKKPTGTTKKPTGTTKKPTGTTKKPITTTHGSSTSPRSVAIGTLVVFTLLCRRLF